MFSKSRSSIPFSMKATRHLGKFSLLQPGSSMDSPKEARRVREDCFEVLISSINVISRRLLGLTRHRWARSIETYVTGRPSLSLPYMCPSLPNISGGNSSFTHASTSNSFRHLRVAFSISWAAWTFSSLQVAYLSNSTNYQGWLTRLALKNFINTTLAFASGSPFGSRVTPQMMIGVDFASG